MVIDLNVVLREGQSCNHGCFVLDHSSHKALQLADSACFHAAKPLVKSFARRRAEHVSELLDQFIRLIHFRMQRPKLRQRFLVVGLQFFRPTKKKEHRLSCQHRRT
jgi:hypothetical protein